MSAEGVIYGVRQFEPFQLDQQTLSLLLRNVWRKLRQDAQLVAEMEEMERKRK